MHRFTLVLLTACAGDNLQPPTPPTDGSFGVFEGKIPCFEGSPVGCQRIKVRLALDNVVASSYELVRVEVGVDNERPMNLGSWTIGEPSEGAIATRLVALDGSLPELSSFLMVGDDLLLVLDATGRPRVGNEVHSYTLSRTE